MAALMEPAATTLRASRDAAETTRRRMFAATFGVYLTALAATIAVIWSRVGGLVFVLDDPYIHLALAENLADHGTFGLEAGAYESASSAPAWTSLLAAGHLLTAVPGPWFVLGLGVASAGWVLWSLTSPRLLDRFQRSPVLVAGILFLPITVGLVPLTLTGMEHTLHAAIVLQILVLLPRLADASAGRGTRLAYYGLLAVASSVRFESVFLAMGCAVGLVLFGSSNGSARSWRRWRPPLATLAASGAPLLVFAFANRAAGQYAVPNSVAAKSAWGGGLLPTVDEITTKLGRDRLFVAVLVVLVAGLGFAIWTRQRALAAPLLALTVASVAHLAFADVGWFDRYQAYLVIAVLGLSLRLVASPPFPRGRTVGTAIGVVLLALMLPRLSLLTQVPGGAQNIHEQQQQMATFLAEHYDGDAVMVNDLGYVAWLHDGPEVDMAGLGTFEVLDATKNGNADPAFFAALAERRDVAVVAIYADLFGGFVPDQWTAVETWCLQDELVTAADDCVTFYATDTKYLPRLIDALDTFDERLPPSVVRLRQIAP